MFELKNKVFKTEKIGKRVYFKKEIKFELEIDDYKKDFIVEINFNEELGIKTLNYLLVRKVVNLNPNSIGEYEEDIYYQFNEIIFYHLQEIMGKPNNTELGDIADKIEYKIQEVIEGENIEIEYKLLEVNL